MRTARVLELFAIALLLFGSLSLQAQRFDTILSKLNREYPQEKLYLHFDRPAYNAGETIWFKAYLFSGNFLSLISKNIYTELLDAEGNVLQHKVSPVTLSSSASSFDISENFAGSHVYVRAYTKWMLNFDSSFIFTKAIPILNSKQFADKFIPVSNRNNPVVTIQQPIFYLQFFPEGGDLIQEVESRVAFKATNNAGMPVNLQGTIFDNKGNKIVPFSSEHDGMGKLTLVPQINKHYKAVWKDAMGYIHETALPDVKQNGVVIEANTYSNQIEYKVKRSANSSISYPFVYVIAQMNQVLLYKAKINLTKTTFGSDVIPTKDLPAGIVQITVFAPNEKPIGERITFVNPSASSFITDLNMALKNLNKREKNVIQIDVPDTLQTNLSVSITDADINPAQQENNIFSHVLLTSEIKGYVHNAAYYFSSDADSVTDHLDLVMMTNGWRRFNWEKVLTGRFPKLNHMPEEYLSIEGQVYGVNKSLLANREINGVIKLKNGNNQFLNTSLLPDGTFAFPDMIFYDTAQFYYQLNNDKKQSLTTRATFTAKNNLLKEGLHQKPGNDLLAGLAKPDTLVAIKNKEIYQEKLKQEKLDRIRVMKEVVVTTKKKSKAQILEEKYTTGLFSGGYATTYIPEDEIGAFPYQSVLQFLQMTMPGLQVWNDGMNVSFEWRRKIPLVYINEWIRDANELRNITVRDVAMIKVYERFWGSYGSGNPAIVVYRKTEYSSADIKGLDHISIAGYSPVKEFYSPDYSKTDSTSLPDYRSTLYWNPFIITGKENRRIILPFYNNDITKKIRIVIEGCNEDGELTHIEKVLQ